MQAYGMSGRVAASEIVLLVALVAGLIASGGVFDLRPPWIVAGSAALVLLLVIWLRWRGRFLTELLATRLRYRNSGDGEPADPLGLMIADAEVTEHIDRAGNRVGLVGAQGEWTAVVRLAQTSTVDLGSVLRALRMVYDRPDIPLRAASLNVWSVPGIAVDEETPADPISVYWLAVRYSASDAPHAALARGGDPAGARRATASSAMGLVALLSQTGSPCSVLDAADLRNELCVALGAGAARDAVTLREGWRELRVQRGRQYCFVPARRRDGRALLGRCVADAEFTATSFTLGRRYHGTAREHVAVRVGVGEDATAPTVRTLSTELGTKLVGCDGRQRRTAVATLPLATAFTR